jgi:hypothetical protein
MLNEGAQTLAQPKSQPVISVKVSPAVYSDVESMAADMGVTMPRLFGYVFGVLKTVMSEGRKGRKLLITSEDGTPITEIVLPNGAGFDALSAIQ